MESFAGGKGKGKRNFRIDPRQNKEVDIHTVSSSQDQNIIVNSTEYGVLTVKTMGPGEWFCVRMDCESAISTGKAITVVSFGD